jgi:tetratricopeptide (TPR) repeat protein
MERKTISRETVKLQLEQLRRAQAEQESMADHSQTDMAYWKAAAVLSGFHPGRLLPVGIRGAKQGAAYTHILPVSEPLPGDGKRSLWRLQNRVRIQALKELRNRTEMKKALKANPERPDDAVQKALEALIRNDEIDYSELRASAIAGHLSAADWLRTVLDDIPSKEMMLRFGARAKLLEPFHELVGEHFVGREEPLTRLRSYVGTLPAKGILESLTRLGTDLYYDLADRPPFFIYGPGGVGKSTLIAKFLIDHVSFDNENQVPFVYLNFDRPALAADQPLTLLTDAAYQIGTQFPEARQDADKLAAGILDALASEDQLEAAKSLLPREQFIKQFASLLEGGVTPDVPVLFVLDTFEEVQFMGDDVVHEIWEFLKSMQKAVPRLRVIIAGRALAKQFPADEEPLGDLDPELARSYVEHVLKKLGAVEPPGEAIDEIINVAGSNPLCLRLAARLFADEGVEGLANVKTRSRFGLRLNAEIVQARLYGRVLSHLHDPNLRQLAHPGLIVRRITPELIRKVLAKPCGLQLEPGDENKLFDDLSREVALVETDPQDGSLRHRQDVRRAMLKELEAETVGIADQINRAAVKFYRGKTGVVARAEEIYHRLRLDQKPSTINKRWLPGVETYLAMAVEEVPPNAGVYLARRLGATPDHELIEHADLDQWEQLTSRRAQRHLSVGSADAALKTLRERSERSPSSPLYSIEVETLRALGRDEEALELARRAIDSATQANDHRLVAEMLRHSSLIHEKLGALEEALHDAREAFTILQHANDPIAYLQITVAILRLFRKLGRDEERAPLARVAIRRLTPELLQRLRKYPALLRESVAELGSMDLSLLRRGIEAVGVEVISDRQKDLLAGSLAQWNDRTHQSNMPGTLDEYVGLPETKADEIDWRQWVETNTGRDLNQHVSRSLRKFDVASETREALAENFRTTVDESIIGKFGRKL